MQFLARQNGRTLGNIERRFRIVTGANDEAVEVLDVVIVASGRGRRRRRGGRLAVCVRHEQSGKE
jgi:hypothetical protein